MIICELTTVDTCQLILLAAVNVFGHVRAQRELLFMMNGMILSWRAGVNAVPDCVVCHAHNGN